MPVTTLPGTFCVGKVKMIYSDFVMVTTGVFCGIRGIWSILTYQFDFAYIYSTNKIIFVQIPKIQKIEINVYVSRSHRTRTV